MGFISDTRRQRANTTKEVRQAFRKTMATDDIEFVINHLNYPEINRPATKYMDNLLEQPNLTQDLKDTLIKNLDESKNTRLLSSPANQRRIQKAQDAVMASNGALKDRVSLLEPKESFADRFKKRVESTKVMLKDRIETAGAYIKASGQMVRDFAAQQYQRVSGKAASAAQATRQKASDVAQGARDKAAGARDVALGAGLVAADFAIRQKDRVRNNVKPAFDMLKDRVTNWGNRISDEYRTRKLVTTNEQRLSRALKEGKFDEKMFNDQVDMLKNPEAYKPVFNHLDEILKSPIVTKDMADKLFDASVETMINADGMSEDEASKVIDSFQNHYGAGYNMTDQFNRVATRMGIELPPVPEDYTKPVETEPTAAKIHDTVEKDTGEHKYHLPKEDNGVEIVSEEEYNETLKKDFPELQQAQAIEPVELENAAKKQINAIAIPYTKDVEADALARHTHNMRLMMPKSPAEAIYNLEDIRVEPRTTKLEGDDKLDFHIPMKNADGTITDVVVGETQFAKMMKDDYPNLDVSFPSLEAMRAQQASSEVVNNHADEAVAQTNQGLTDAEVVVPFVGDDNADTIVEHSKHVRETFTEMGDGDFYHLEDIRVEPRTDSVFSSTDPDSKLAFHLPLSYKGETVDVILSEKEFKHKMDEDYPGVDISYPDVESMQARVHQSEQASAAAQQALNDDNMDNLLDFAEEYADKDEMADFMSMNLDRELGGNDQEMAY